MALQQVAMAFCLHLSAKWIEKRFFMSVARAPSAGLMRNRWLHFRPTTSQCSSVRISLDGLGTAFDMFLAEAHSSELSRNRQLLRFCHASEDFLFFLFYLFVFERRRMGNTLIVRMFLDRFSAD